MVRSLLEADCKEVVALGSKDGNLTVESEVVALFEKLTAKEPIDIVVHLAGLIGGIQANKSNPGQFFYTNLMVGALTMHYSYKYGVKKYIAAGAGCGYPEFAPIPTSEKDYWNGFPQRDSAPYSLAKRMLHVQSFAYWDEFQFPAIIGIPGNIYGEFDNFDLEKAHVIPALVRKFVEAADDNKSEVVVWGAGKATRDFVYAGDVAKGLMLAVEKYHDSQMVNLSSGTDTSIREVVEILQEVSGFKGKVVWDTTRLEGQARRRFDISKAENDLGYKPTTSLEDGLRVTVDWYRANRATARNKVA
jgi:GDP-L-fucose synthase